MTRPLSDDLRKRVIEAVESGLSRRAAAKRYGICEATAIRWAARWRKTGSWAPMKMGSHSSRSPLEAFSNEIIALIDTKPDITLTEIVGHLEVEYGLKTSRSSVDRFFARNGVTLKKRQRMQQNRSGKT